MFPIMVNHNILNTTFISDFRLCQYDSGIAVPTSLGQNFFLSGPHNPVT
jgi:hypothetical protein